MEFLVLGLFCSAMLCCLVLGLSVIYALAFGLAIFVIYGHKRGFSWRELLAMALRGASTVKNIAIIMFAIGMLTALWRAAGTIPAIVSYAAKLIRPSGFLPMTFLLCCAFSTLTGSAIASSATIGVICMIMAKALGVNVLLAGGAVLSGASFGDRYSPVSSSAALVSEVTKTKLFDNLKRMLRSSLVPFAASLIVFAVLGLGVNTAGKTPDLAAVFSLQFNIHWLTLLPAAIILVLSVFRVNVKLTMALSILCAALICVFMQDVKLLDVLKLSYFGYESELEQTAAMLNGGGIASMLKVIVIVCIGASYSEIFNKTGLLTRFKKVISSFSGHTTKYVATLFTALITCMITCSQALCVILTNQLCSDVYDDRSELALDLEDSCIVTAMLIPWSVACTAPLAAIDVNAGAILFAVYIYALPIWRIISSIVKKRHGESKRKNAFTV